MFILSILEKIKEARLKLYQGSVVLLKRMKNYQKLKNTQLTKLRSAATNKAGTILRISKNK